MLSRLAPTPSGFLHVGNAFSFLLTWLHVRRAAGKLLLRIDDLDADRMRPDYVEDVFRSLEWLGLDWDFGPQGPDDLSKTWSQRHRLQLYEELLRRLPIFACECSRKELPSGPYPGTCLPKRIPLQRPETAWRLTVPDEAIGVFEEWGTGQTTVPIGQTLGSFVVRRKDNGRPAYQVSSVADDLHFGVDFVVRGLDLWDSTAAQAFLAQQAQAVDFQRITFLHHALQTDESGRKLSKSEGALALQTMRKQGCTPADVIRAFCQWQHLPAVGSLPELSAVFSALPSQQLG